MGGNQRSQDEGPFNREREELTIPNLCNSDVEGDVAPFIIHRSGSWSGNLAKSAEELCEKCVNNPEKIPAVLNSLLREFCAGERTSIVLLNTLVLLGLHTKTAYSSELWNQRVQAVVTQHELFTPRLDVLDLLVSEMRKEESSDIARFGALGAVANQRCEDPLADCIWYSDQLCNQSYWLSMRKTPSFDAATRKKSSTTAILIGSIAELDESLGFESINQILRRFEFMVSRIRPESKRKIPNVISQEEVATDLAKTLTVVQFLSEIHPSFANTLIDELRCAAQKATQKHSDVIGGMLRGVADGRCGLERRIIDSFQDTIDQDFLALKYSGPLDPDCKERVSRLSGNIIVLADFASRDIRTAGAVMPYVAEMFSEAFTQVYSLRVIGALGIALTDLVLSLPESASVADRHRIIPNLIDSVCDSEWIRLDDQKKEVLYATVSKLLLAGDSDLAFANLSYFFKRLKDLPASEQEAWKKNIIEHVSMTKEGLYGFVEYSLSSSRDANQGLELLRLTKRVCSERKLSIDDRCALLDNFRDWYDQQYRDPKIEDWLLLKDEIDAFSLDILKLCQRRDTRRSKQPPRTENQPEGM